MIATTIVCVECGDTCHLLTVYDDPDDPPRAGDVVVYRCAGCADRFDVVVDEADLSDGDD